MLKYHPPMAGAIYWVRQLFHRLRKPVLTIQNVAELKYNHLKILAFNQYYDLSKQLKSYEELKFQQWTDKAQIIVINTMRRNILMMMRSDPDKGRVANCIIFVESRNESNLTTRSFIQVYCRSRSLINQWRRIFIRFLPIREGRAESSSHPDRLPRNRRGTTRCRSRA